MTKGLVFQVLLGAIAISFVVIMNNIGNIIIGSRVAVLQRLENLDVHFVQEFVPDGFRCIVFDCAKDNITTVLVTKILCGE